MMTRLLLTTTLTLGCSALAWALSPAATATSRSGAKVWLSGTVSVSTAYGTRATDVQGEITVLREQGPERVAVRHGHWRVALDRGEVVRFDRDALLDGRGTVLHTAWTSIGPLVQDHDGVTLDARRLPSTYLVVLDAENRQPVSGLEVVETQAFRFDHPGRIRTGDVVAKSAESPLRIDPRSHAEDAYFVRAPGYGWHRVELDHEVGGECVVLLERGEAQVTVQVPHAAAAVTALRITTADDPRTALPLVLDDRGTVTLDHLQPGDYVLQATVGGDASLQQVVTVVPGRNRVTVPLVRSRA